MSRPKHDHDQPAYPIIHHSWLSNPLDWPHIDRMILLAMLILISPVLISLGIGLLYWFSPDKLNWGVAKAYLYMQLFYFLLLSGFILTALKLRQRRKRWQLMESFVIYSYMLVIFTGAWLIGTPFTVGLLLLILGISVASPLASIRQLKHAYLVSIPIFILFLLAIVSGAFSYAPLFSTSPYLPDGSPRTFWLFFQVWLDIVVLPILFIALIATDRWNRRENDYRTQSAKDSLTGLSNRRTFVARCEEEFRQLQQNPDRQLSCIMLDIDHFKQINDHYGHQAGDAVLTGLASLLTHNARRYDEVGRYGGEEFVVLLPDTPAQTVKKIAERIREQIENTPIEADGTLLNIKASFGVATCPTHDITDPDSLVKAADTALYAAKENGRNRVVAAS